MDNIVPTLQPLTTYLPATAREAGCVVDAVTSDEIGAPVVKVRCEVYSRIVGYMRPVSSWNAGKRREFEERLTFDGSVNE